MSHFRCGLLSLVTAVFVLAASTAPANGQCQGWLPGQGAPATSGEFRAAVIFDADGPGSGTPSLFVGGDFSGAVGAPLVMTNDLAVWDGVRWNGAGPFPLNGRVNALVTFDLDGDGPNLPRLIVGGAFQLGVPPNILRNIFTWDGITARTLGEGFNNEVRALHLFDPDGNGPLPPQLYAAGTFTSSGSTALPTGVARWNGVAWESAGTGISGTVNVLTTFDPDGAGPLVPMLVAGGNFRRNGLPSALAGLSNTQWNTIGGAFNNEVTSIATFDFDGDGPEPARLIAAGLFTGIGASNTFRGQAFFNGTAWQPIAPFNQNSASTCRTIGVYDPDGPGPIAVQLLLSGNILLPGSFVPQRLVRLEQGAWIPVSPPNATGEVYAMTQLVLPGETEPQLFVAGSLTVQQPPQALRLAVLANNALHTFQDGFGAIVRNLAVSHQGNGDSIIAVGDFTRVPGTMARGVAAYRDGVWSPLGPVGTENVLAQTVYAYDPDGDGPRTEVVVVGGVFESIGGVAAHNVAQWDGSLWSAMDTGPTFYPTQFVNYDADGAGPTTAVLLAAGDAPSGGPGTPAHIMGWNGTAWSQFGPDFVSVNGPGMITRVATMDPDGIGPLPRVLIVTGLFSRVGRVAVNNIASFDGQQWRALGTGLNTNAQALYTWDRFGNGRESVVIGGALTTAGGITAHGIAVWNGSSWSTLGTGFGVSESGFPTYPTGLAAFDIDGEGPLPSELYATGYFAEASGHPVSGIARWNGTQWQGVGSGLDRPAGYALAVLNHGPNNFPALFVGGIFQAAGGSPSAFVARYSIQACCSADFNADGYVTTQDLFDFLDAFFELTPSADINHDSFINSMDFFELLTGLFAGC